MKKTTLTIALFSVVLVATSFAAPQSSNFKNTVITTVDGNGAQSIGNNKKLDYNEGDKSNNMSQITMTGGSGSQSSGDNRKRD